MRKLKGILMNIRGRERYTWSAEKEVSPMAYIILFVSLLLILLPMGMKKSNE